MLPAVDSFIPLAWVENGDRANSVKVERIYLGLGTLSGLCGGRHAAALFDGFA